MVVDEGCAEAAGPSLCVRRQMAVLARQKRCRTSEWTQDRPTEWRPHTVRARTGGFFTNASAWNFVAELVESGYPMREVVLRHPAGKTAYEMTVLIEQGGPEIYIKVRLSRQIIGYSFHYSIYSLTRRFYS